MKYNKLFILMFVMIILVGSVNAFKISELNDRLVYSKNDLKVSLENWWGLGKTIGTAELKSHNSVDEIRPVKLGESVVMWYDLDFVDLYESGLGDIEIINMNNGEIIQRNYKFVYWGNETYQVPNFICNDVLNKNGTMVNECSESGTKDKIREAWLPYNSRDILKGKITIGLEINMFMDETLDIFWKIGGKKIERHAVVSSGAVETIDGDFTIFTFSNNGTFNVTATDLNTTVLIVAGGGAGGGKSDSGNAGGGGSGAYFFEVGRTISVGNFNVIVGTGGITTDTFGGNGTNSSFDGVIREGGGGGGHGFSPGFNGLDGGSGGGGSQNAGGGGSGSTGGNDGGNGVSDQAGGGGGGAGAVGDDATAFNGGAGGDGLSNNINGTLTFYGGGGGGGANRASGSLGGAGGNGGGGVGSSNNSFASGAGVDGLGGGGGGGGNTLDGADGGDGIVIIRVLTADLISELTITLNSPIDNEKFTTPTINFNASVVSENFRTVTNVSLFIDGILNQTNSSGINNTDYIFTATLSDGTHNYTYEAFNNESISTTTITRTFAIDSIFPTIIVTSPTGDEGTFSSGANLTLTWTANDTNIDVCQYDYQGFNTTVACGSSPIDLTVNDSTQTSLTFYVNDTFGQTSFNSTSWSYSFIEENITFTPNVFETDSQFFQINLSTSVNVSAISAELNYNGTNFISSAACDEFCLVNNTIDIPLVTEGEFENKSFFWEISIFNGTDSINVNTSLTEQNVTRIHLEECDATFTVEALNFTVNDEQNLSRIDPFLFDGDFEQWLGTGDVKRQSNFTNSSISEKTLCITPADETFFIDSTIEYDEAGNASIYTLRNYYFQNDTISNVSQDILMYLLQSSFSTSFILKVQDDALLPVIGVLIETNRFYPGLNEFRIVQIAKTDDLGKSVGFFETEIVDYKFLITFNNDTLLETGIQKVIPESSPFTLTFNLGVSLGEPWSSQIPINNLISTLIWNDITGIVTYNYIDSSTNLTLARLFVIQQSLVNSSADSTICNENSTLNSAILTCNVGNDSGFYTASSFITRDSIETLDLQISFQIETLSSIVGLLGLFYGWFLILIASFMFRFNEIAGIWSITITVLLVNLIGLINFGGVFVTAIIGIAIFLTWLMSN